MTIQVIKTTVAPKGVNSGKFKPQYKELYDLKESILQKYLDPARQPEVTRTDSGDLYTVVIKSYYKSLDDYNNCMAELHEQIGNIAVGFLEKDREVVRTRITKLLKIVNLDDNTVIREESEMEFGDEFGSYVVS